MTLDEQLPKGKFIVEKWNFKEQKQITPGNLNFQGTRIRKSGLINTVLGQRYEVSSILDEGTFCVIPGSEVVGMILEMNYSTLKSIHDSSRTDFECRYLQH